MFGLNAEEPFFPSTTRHRALGAWKAANDARLAAAKRAGVDVLTVGLLEPIALHEARHTRASVFIAAGANPKIMGHASIQMTFDRYGHLMPGGLDEAAERVNAYLRSASTGL